MRRIKTKPITRLCALFLSALLFVQSTPVSAAGSDAHTLYTGPSEHAAAVGTFSDGETVTLLRQVNTVWSRIRLADGTVGYCDASLLGTLFTEHEPSPTDTYKTTRAVQILSSPETDAPVLGVLPQNTVLPYADDMENGFIFIRLENGLLGYLPADAVTPQYEQPAAVRTTPKLAAHTGITTETEAAARLTELSAYFQNGRYWNCLGTGLSQSADNLFCVTDTPCAHPSHGYSYCNIYTSSMSRKMGYGQGMQCLGYVGLLSDLTFGTEAPVTVHSDFEKLRVGDHIRLVLWDHSMLVTKVCKDENDRTYVYVTEVNADYDTCRIDWGRKFTQDDLRRLGDYVEIYTRYPTE